MLTTPASGVLSRQHYQPTFCADCGREHKAVLQAFPAPPQWLCVNRVCESCPFESADRGVVIRHGLDLQRPSTGNSSGNL